MKAWLSEGVVMFVGGVRMFRIVFTYCLEEFGTLIDLFIPINTENMLLPIVSSCLKADYATLSDLLPGGRRGTR